MTSRHLSLYPRGMVLGLALVALAATLGNAAEPIAPSWATEAGKPVYRAAQGIADGLYALASGRLIAPLLPDRLASRISSVPDEDSLPIFAAHWREKEERAAAAGLAARPTGDAATPMATAAWSRDQLDAQRHALIDAFAATLVDRYRLQKLGRATSAYARNADNWNADFLVPGILLGGAYAYLAGIRADLNVRQMHVRLDMAPGERIRSAAQGDESRRLARLAISRRGSPLSVYAEWSAHAPQRLGANWSRRF